MTLMLNESIVSDFPTATLPSPTASLGRLAPLLRDLNNLKRVRAAHFAGSYADRLFAAAWQQLLAGTDPAAVALTITARAVAATRLSSIDATVLRAHGLSPGEAANVLTTALDDTRDMIPPPLWTLLKNALASATVDDSNGNVDEANLPPFVGRLIRQPRAGATHPGKPRMVLEPAESHGDHCLLVAVYGVLVGPRFGGDPGTAFLAGLAHHLFNASLPDAGFDGDIILAHAGVRNRVAQAAFDAAFAELDRASPRLLQGVQAALAFTAQVDPPGSQCFHAADVLDRVLEMAWFDRCAAFTLAHAVRDLDIVHVAPEQTFQRQVLTEAGVWHDWPTA